MLPSQGTPPHSLEVKTNTYITADTFSRRKQCRFFQKIIEENPRCNSQSCPSIPPLEPRIAGHTPSGAYSFSLTRPWNRKNQRKRKRSVPVWGWK